MLHLLLLLSALVSLAGAQQTFSSSATFDLSSCPITIYGQKYEHVYANFTSENLVVCFNGFFRPGAKDDCLFGPLPNSNSAGFDIYQRIPFLEALVRYNIPQLKSRMDCFLSFSFQLNMGYASFALINFGSLSALYVYSPAIGTVLVDVQIDGKKLDSVTVSKQQSRGYLDLSGCRHAGVLYKPGSELNKQETCFSLSCDEEAQLLTSTCAPSERCLRNGSCIVGTAADSAPPLDATCTVTGSSVIDFQGGVASVRDRCAYSLLSITSVPELLVLGFFRERWRKDMSVLDSVALRLNSSGVQIHLKQDGRVMVNDATLVLDRSAQTVHGVELSRDWTGVTAKLRVSNFSAQLFFDGSTAQVHMEGPAGSVLDGLCGNSSRAVADLRLSRFSSSSCQEAYSDRNDTLLNCTRKSERCNVLREAPFSSCEVDPEPYITACTETLCSSPGLDGLRCQFLEAYTRTCRLNRNTTVEGWRSSAGCRPVLGYCANRTCSDHEFCAERPTAGDTRCFCRAIFASKYRRSNSLGDPAVCSQNSASIWLVACLLEDRGIDSSQLHLNDPSCRGQMNQQNLLTFSFNSTSSCGTEVTSNKNQIVYRNTITNQNRPTEIITRTNQLFLDFSCAYLQEALKGVTVRSRCASPCEPGLNSSALQSFMTGLWNYTLTMKAYTDAGRTHVVGSSTEVRLNQKIWLELKTTGLDPNLIAVVTDSCWATAHGSQDIALRHDLIVNGCPNPADGTVELVGNGRGTSNYFSFNMFQFTGSSRSLDLHCRLHLCIRTRNRCAPICAGSRRRRSIRSGPESSAHIILALSD